MAIVYRTDGDWGTGKGAQLLADEIDNNFFELLTRAAELEENPASPVNIESIEVEGATFIVYMTDATTRGPFTLPIASFKWRGRWTPGESYQQLDLIYLEDEGLYLVQLAHVAGETFEQINYVQLIGQASIYDMALYLPGLVGDGLDAESPLMQTIIARPMFIEEDNAGNVYARVPPEGRQFYAVMRKNGAAIGNIQIEVGANVGTITVAENVLFEAGDVFSIDQASVEPETETGTVTETETLTEGVLPIDLSISIKAIRGEPA